MKKCLSCNIEIGGNPQSCPLCQNTLMGEETPANWPVTTEYKKYKLFNKIQTFIVLTAVAISLIIDYRLNLNMGKHWSIAVLIWSFAFELVLQDLLKRRVVVAKTMTICMLLTSILFGVTGWYFGFFPIMMYLVIPIVVSITIITNLVFAFIDKHGNTLVYLLMNLVFAVIPYVVFAITKDDNMMLPWSICVMIAIGAFFGIIIFRGRKVLSELQKRMNF